MEHYQGALYNRILAACFDWDSGFRGNLFSSHYPDYWRSRGIRGIGVGVNEMGNHGKTNRKAEDSLLNRRLMVYEGMAWKTNN